MPLWLVPPRWDRSGVSPADLPAHALRDVGYLQRLADGTGPAVGAYAAALLDHTLPWTRVRQVYALLGRAPRRCRCPACPPPGSPRPVALRCHPAWPGRPAVSPPVPAITPELRSLLRCLKLGQLMPTLPERLALARASELSHAEFLELILSDEASRRDANMRRALPIMLSATPFSCA